MRATGPGQSALLLLDVIDTLNNHKVAYAIIGAFAASYYGVVRASLDADAMISIQSLQDINGLVEYLRGAGFHVEQRRGDTSDPIAAVVHVQDGFQNRVDLIAGIRGTDKEIFDRARTAQFMGEPIRIVGLEDFIVLKLFAGRPKDTQDIIGVLGVSGAQINLDLLEKLTAPYGAVCVHQLKLLLKQYLLP